jgi:hypothetical protein
MRSKAKPSDLSLGTPLAGVDRDIDMLVDRFDAARRRSVRRLVSTSPRLADLAISFPAAVYALASRQGAQRRRQKALQLTIEGAPLRDVAVALDLPLWLRRLPPYREPPSHLRGRQRVLAEVGHLRRTSL